MGLLQMVSKLNPKSKMIAKHLFDPVYGANVLILANCNAKEASEYLNKKKVNHTPFPQADGCSMSLEDTLSDGSVTLSYVIWVNRSTDRDVIMHECVHLVKSVFKDRGIPFNENNDESIAYYQMYWVKRINKLFGNSS